MKQFVVRLKQFSMRGKKNLPLILSQLLLHCHFVVVSNAFAFKPVQAVAETYKSQPWPTSKQELLTSD
jgi:hypothetical protein